MGWRKIRPADVGRGVVIRLSNMTDTPFNGATIVGVVPSERQPPLVYVSRPYVYAHEDFDNPKGGLIGCETFSIYIDTMCLLESNIEVYESDHHSNVGELRTMLT